MDSFAHSLGGDFWQGCLLDKCHFFVVLCYGWKNMEDKIEEIKTEVNPTVTPNPMPRTSNTPVRPVSTMSKPKLPSINLPGFMNKKFFSGLLVLIIVVALILGITVGLPLYKAYADGKKAYTLALAVKDAAKTQDIKKIADAITAAKNQMLVVQSDLQPLGWTKSVPLLGGYTSDVMHLADAGTNGLAAAEIAANAVEPYADILGLKGQGTFAGGTTEDRIALAVTTLGKVTPQIDSIAVKMAQVKSDMDQVDTTRYPETFQGKPVRSTLVQAKSVVDLVGELLTQARPMVKQLPDLLGANGERKYMVLFQNDKELRPTGGFITAYAIFRIDHGKINLDSANDIYTLDGTITKNVAPPDPIAKYLNVYGWRLRDSNFSPDFYSSMRTFEDLYNSSPQKEDIQGIVAMDTQVLVDMMNVLGPIPAYGTNFTTQTNPDCGCAMVIYELEQFADQPTEYLRQNRKDIIGVLLQAIMHKALAAPKQIYGPLFQVALADAQQKHILFYLHDTGSQQGLEALNFAGRIKTYDGDYLHINDANLGGAKSNLYIVESATQKTTVDSSGAQTTLTIQYKYPHQADNCSLERKSGLCLAGIYRDYLRVYLPTGATVSRVLGFESQSTTSQALDHTVVDGFFTVVPEGLAKIEITYKVPGNFQKTGAYKELIQKQPGTMGNHFTVTVNGQTQSFDLTTDQELEFKL